MVSTFSRANNAAFRLGFARDMKTYLVVAGEITLFMALEWAASSKKMSFTNRNLVSIVLPWKFPRKYN